MKLGTMISNYMQEKQLSFRELAHEIGCDPTTLHRMVRGAPCRMDLILKILCWLAK
jgi:hypothetical protein